MTVSEQFAAYACGSPLGKDETKTVAEVQSRILDYITVTRAASHYSDFIPRIKAFAKTFSNKCDGKYPVNIVGFLNAAFAHSLDYDDGHLWAGVHAAGPVIGTAFALAPRYTPSGFRLLQAVVAGYEIEYRLAKALGKSHIQKGYHGSCTCGVFGSTITAGMLADLTEKQMAYALGLAGLACSGYRQSLAEGQMAKPVQVGYAADRGIVAMLLAAEGVEAPLQIFEGKSGLFSILTDTPKEQAVADSLKDLGTTRLIHDTYTKLYPCCRYTHPAIEACFALRSEIGDIDDIESLEVDTFDIAYEATAPNQKPQSPAEARFSMDYIAAVALREGFVGLEDFTEKSIARPEMAELGAKVVCCSTKEWNDLYPDIRGAELRVIKKTGEVFSHKTIKLSGMDGDHAEVRRKFRNALSVVYAPKKLQEVEGCVESLPSLDSVATLAKLIE